jgi:DNA-binding transcriptional ArsR family regulator
MSRSTPEAGGAKRRQHAVLFAALGDETRLSLIGALATGEQRSIVQLTGGTRLSRQAVTKHLKVLEHAGVVRCLRRGRERRYGLDPAPMKELEQYLRRVSEQWDVVLERLKAFVEV